MRDKIKDAGPSALLPYIMFRSNPLGTYCGMVIPIMEQPLIGSADPHTNIDN